MMMLTLRLDYTAAFCVRVGQAMVLIISDNPAIVAIVHDNYKA